MSEGDPREESCDDDYYWGVGLMLVFVLLIASAVFGRHAAVKK